MWLYIVLSLLLITFVAVNIFLAMLVRSQTIKIEKYEAWVLSVIDECQKTYLRLKEIDDKQMFEKDDDVGWIFSKILKIIEELESKVK
jgi:hypothetical protein